MNTIQSIKRALRIGNRINNSTTGSVLHIDSSNKLAEDNANFSYSSEKLTVKDVAISSSTASRLTATDANKKLVSVSDLTAWLIQTLKQVLVADNGDGTVTLSLPQDIDTDTDADVEFDTLTLGDMTAGSVPFIGTGGLISEDNANLFWDDTNKRLGINETTPLSKMHITNPTATSIGQIIKGAAGQSADLFQLKDSSDTALSVFDSAGQLGIGISTPNNTLQVAGLINFDDTLNNVFLGTDSGSSVTTGKLNVGIGKGALDALTEGDNNTAIGKDAAGALTTGDSNFALGTNALLNTTTFSSNVAIGISALQTNNQGGNVAIGTTAMLLTAAAFNNVVIGFNAGSGTAGNSYNSNVMIGYRSGRALSTGSSNVFLGHQTGDSVTTGASNILIGYNVDTPAVDTDDHLNIGNTIYADLSTGYVGIGTTTPAAVLHIKAAAAQSVDLLQYQKSDDTVYSGVDSDGERFQIDDIKNWFGTGNDASIYYDGTDLIIDSDSGDLILSPDGSVSIPVSLKVGDTTNYTEIKTDGEIELHGTARVYKNEWINVQGLKAPGTKPATLVDWGISCAWEFSDGTDDTICTSIRIPQDMDKTVAPELRIGFASDTNTGDVVWQLEYLYLAPNEDTTASAQETLTTTTTISGTADGLTIATITGMDLPSSTDQLIKIRIKRLGADGDDTLSDDCVLNGVGLRYVANKLGQGL